ncbi:phage baseplate protein [Endozoicomonas sp. 2B-B]
MSGVILDPITSQEAIMANFQRLNEAITAMQGGSIALSQITGYEDLVTTTALNSQVEALQAENDKLKYRVGDIHISTTSTNPKDYFGYGTWELTGGGRTLVGHGTTTDSRGEELTFSAGQTGGEFKHKQTESEMVAHKHSSVDGELFGKWAADGGRGQNNWSYQSDLPDPKRHGGYKTGTTGGGQPFNVMQPYVVMYFWKRTA